MIVFRFLFRYRPEQSASRRRVILLPYFSYLTELFVNGEHYVNIYIYIAATSNV